MNHEGSWKSGEQISAGKEFKILFVRQTSVECRFESIQERVERHDTKYEGKKNELESDSSRKRNEKCRKKRNVLEAFCCLPDMILIGIYRRSAEWKIN